MDNVESRSSLQLLFESRDSVVPAALNVRRGPRFRTLLSSIHKPAHPDFILSFIQICPFIFMQST
jgi:hypothetical protein